MPHETPSPYVNSEKLKANLFQHVYFVIGVVNLRQKYMYQYNNITSSGADAETIFHWVIQAQMWNRTYRVGNQNFPLVSCQKQTNNGLAHSPHSNIS